MQQELRAKADLIQNLIRPRKIMLFTVAFSTTERGDELTRERTYSQAAKIAMV